MVNMLPGGLGDDAFISELFFSFEGSDLSIASFMNFGGSQIVSMSDFTIDPPGKQVGYDFFLSLDFPTSASDDRFFDGETAEWKILGVSADDFLLAVAGGVRIAQIPQQLDERRLRHAGHADGSSYASLSDGCRDHGVAFFGPQAGHG